MDYSEFNKILCNELSEIELQIDNNKSKELYIYMNTLIEWNKTFNLTAIINQNEIIVKHFIDSFTVNKYIKENSNIIDIGTGAGFPGVPLAIYRKDINVTLMDSLNKRINFLNEIVKIDKLKNVNTIHGRAEDYGQNNEYREYFDIAVSRAVAPLNVLVEYLLPFVKVGGICICMKGPNYKEELENINNALKKLGGEIEKIDNIKFNNNNIERNVIIIKKIKITNKIYPRKAGTPSKNPL